jgi:O-antigen ligase
MYVVVVAAALALAWELVRDDARRVRELGAIALPLGLFVAWSGVTFVWSRDRREGAIFLLFFVLPFGLLAVSLARLPWRAGWLKVLYVQLAAMGAAFGLVGVYQYATRNVFWNPKVIVDNAYAPSSWFYRVNSVFYDPSIYGRFLVIAMLAGVAVICVGAAAAAWAALGIVMVTWAGLVPSFSQSSFVALGVGVVAAVAVLWRRRSLGPIAVALAALALVVLALPQTRHRLLGDASSSHATGGRSKLVSNGIRVAVHHPVFGVGTGGFRRAYADLTHLKGKKPKAAASHDTPITVAAETGLPGLALLAWLIVVGLGLPFRLALRARAPTLRTCALAFGLALLAIFVHSLFYNALFEDPLFWGVLALSALAARVEAV